MKKEEILSKIKGKLIVSCQALEEEPLYNKDFSLMPFMAKAAMLGGACAIRTNSYRDVLLIKKEVGKDVPVIGLIKKEYEGGEQYITVTMNEIDQLVEAGADVIALDCTLRPRYDGSSINDFVKEIKDKYKDIVLMADISNYEEGVNAAKMGVDMVGTTLNGYTPYTNDNKVSNLELVNRLSKAIDIPVIAEGKIYYPEDAKKMLEVGAYSVVVGGAITRPLEITKRFVDTIK